MTIQNLDNIEVYISMRLSHHDLAPRYANDCRAYIRRFVDWTAQTQQIDITEDMIPTYRNRLSMEYSYLHTKKIMSVIKKYINWCVQIRNGSLTN